MPVLVSGAESVWKPQFGRLEVNHNDRVHQEGAGSSGFSGGAASVVGGVIERDSSALGRSSAFTTRQEAKVRSQKVTQCCHMH